MDLFKILLEHSEDAVFILCADTGRILTANRTACENLHLDHEGLCGQSLDALLPERDRLRLRAFIEEDGRTANRQLVLFTTLQGSIGGPAPVKLRCTACPQGSDAHVLAIARDVNTQSGGADASRDTESQYQLLAESARDVIWSLDLRDRRFTYFSPSIERLTGLNPEEALARPLSDSLTTESLERVLKIVREELAYDEDEKADPSRTRQLELDYVRKDGSTVCAETTVAFLRGSGGSPKGLVGVSRDISEQRDAESKLRESESRYRDILDNIEDGYYEVDLQGSITFFNAALVRMVGTDPDSLAGLNNRSYMDKDTYREVFQLFNAVYRSGKPAKMKDWEIIDQNGNRHIIEASISLRRDPQGNPIGFAGITRDISERVRVEAALRTSEERNRLAMDVAQLGTWEWDLNSGRRAYSKRFREILDFTEESDIDGLELIYSRLRPQDAKASRAAIRAILAGELTDYSVEHPIILRNGEKRWIASVGRVYLDAEGKPSRFMGTAMDITARKLAEEALRASQTNLAEAQRISHLGSWAWSLPENRIEWSDETYRIYGAEKGEFDGTIEGFLKFVHPEDHEAVENARKSYDLRTRTFILEHRIVRKDGAERIVEEHGEVQVDEDTGEITVLGAVLDVTDRKKIEEALRHRVEFERLVTSISAEFVDLKPQDVDEGIQRALKTLGEFTEMDRSYIYQYRDDGMIADNTHEWCAEGIEPEIAINRNLNLKEQSPIFAARIRANKVVNMPDVKNIPPEGKKEREQLEGMGIRSLITVPMVARGVVIGFLGFNRGSSTKAWSKEDIVLLGVIAEIFTNSLERKRAESERERLEAQILQAQKLESLGVLAGGIAHDFNNLLTGILGYASLVRRGLSTDSRLHRYAEEIEKVASRAADLTNQMLAYSGRGKFVVENVNLSVVVEDMSDLLRMSSSKKANLAFNLDPSLPTIEADGAQLQQVVMNLVTNSSDALGEKTGAIMVSTGAMHANERYLASAYLDEKLSPGKYVYLEVSDSGCGMDEETLARIFDPFFTTKFTGRGLGLAAILGIIRGHAGTIKVDSRVGKGTTTRILFPIVESSPPVSLIDGRSRTRQTEVQESTGVILVVDDEEIIRNLAESVLEEAGYQLLFARDGVEGIKLYKQNRETIRVVLLDLTMPNMDGEETLGELRKIDPDVRVLLSSGYTEDDVTQRFGDKGPAGFIQKPYQAEDLLEKVALTLKS